MTFVTACLELTQRVVADAPSTLDELDIIVAGSSSEVAKRVAEVPASADVARHERVAVVAHDHRLAAVVPRLAFHPSKALVVRGRYLTRPVPELDDVALCNGRRRSVLFLFLLLLLLLLRRRGRRRQPRVERVDLRTIIRSVERGCDQMLKPSGG